MAKTKGRVARFKYLCPACTNEAAFLVDADDSFGSMICPHCGKGITFDPDQVVELRPGESQ